MIGGLGNQMFQYALFRNLYSKDAETYYEPFVTKPYHNGFELDKVFNIIEKPISSLNEVNKLERFQENTWPNFNPAILLKENVYLCGNWQNIGYFGSEEQLIKDFTFKQELDSKNKDILETIKETNSISIHIRKGDYTNAAHINYFFQADWLNYYGIAAATVSRKTNNKLIFYIFSDNTDWAKKNILLGNCIFVENKKQDSWKDMMLMSSCKHNIIANSTFSWWAAWLNKNPHKIIITPKRWFSDDNINNKLTILNNFIKL